MKKTTTIALLSLSLGFTAQAQKQYQGMQSTGRQFPGVSVPAKKSTATVSGVLFPAAFGTSSPCGSGIYTYRINDTSGYFAGSNRFGDKELLMRYRLSDYGVGLPATVDTVLAYFGAKHVGGNSSVRAKVYAATASGAPGALLGTSNARTVTSLDTTGGPTNFSFPAAISLTSNIFFVGVDISSLYATGDSVALFSTDDQCASTDTMSAWTRISDDSFLAFNDGDNWGFAMDLAIFAHVRANELSVSRTAPNAYSASASPVPASGRLTIRFTGKENNSVALTLKDISGRVVASQSMRTAAGILYSVPLDVSNMSAGMYFVEISSGSDRSILKVSVGP